MDDLKPEDLIRIWEEAVETQMHFNEMSVKSRQLGFTFVAAALGVAAFLLSRGEDFSILFPTRYGTFHLHISVLLIVISIIAVFAIKRLDLGVYHRMLRGAVTFGEDFEENYLKKIVDLEKGMTQTISHYSETVSGFITGILLFLLPDNSRDKGQRPGQVFVSTYWKTCRGSRSSTPFLRRT